MSAVPEETSVPRQPVRSPASRRPGTHGQAAGLRASAVRVQTYPGYEALLATVAATGQEPDAAELERLRSFGEQAAVDGTTLRGLVVCHLTRTRTAWPTGAAGADHVLAAVQLAVEALSEGYERAQQLAVREQEAARREFIDDLLYGRGDSGFLAERAEQFGLRFSHAHAVAVAEGPAPYIEGDPVPRRVERAVTGRFGERSILLTTKDGRLICIAPGTSTTSSRTSPNRPMPRRTAGGPPSGGRIPARAASSTRTKKPSRRWTWRAASAWRTRCCTPRVFSSTRC